MPDRFSAHEDFEWAKGSFDDGSWARITGHAIDSNPPVSVIGEFAVKSWKAGWVDADMQIASDGGPKAAKECGE